MNRNQGRGGFNRGGGHMARNSPRPNESFKQENKHGHGENNRNIRSYRAHPLYGFDKIKEKVMTELNKPQLDLPALPTEERKFNSQARLFIGNLPREIKADDVKALFAKHGEIGNFFFSKEGSYAFINMDSKASAESAKSELQGHILMGRPMKVRYSSVSSGLKIKNLTPCVSNELLHLAFGVFGEIESCKVIVDDRGKATGDGEIIFVDKKSMVLALKKCQEECYFLTSSLRPVIVEVLEPKDEEEGNPEASIYRNEAYRTERKEGPRFADTNTFEYEYGIRWKRLYEMYKEKKALLESDLKAEIEQLEARFALVKHEHETEKLRRELMQREAESQRFREHAEMVQERYRGTSRDEYYRDGAGFGDRMNDSGRSYGNDFNESRYSNEYSQQQEYNSRTQEYGNSRGGDYGNARGGDYAGRGGYGERPGYQSGQGGYGPPQGGRGGYQGGQQGGQQGGNNWNKGGQGGAEANAPAGKEVAADTPANDTAAPNAAAAAAPKREAADNGPQADPKRQRF